MHLLFFSLISESKSSTCVNSFIAFFVHFPRNWIETSLFLIILVLQSKRGSHLQVCAFIVTWKKGWKSLFSFWKGWKSLSTKNNDVSMYCKTQVRLECKKWIFWILCSHSELKACIPKLHILSIFDKIEQELLYF